MRDGVRLVTLSSPGQGDSASCPGGHHECEAEHFVAFTDIAAAVVRYRFPAG